MMEKFEVMVKPQVGSVQCDFEGAKEYLSRRLEDYKGIIFTEESKKDAKDTVAQLRKEKKAFADRVKEVKEEYMAPFLAFSEQANELIAMYEEPISYINLQVENFERKRIEEKKASIRKLYEECIADMANVLPLEKIYNPKWENATTNPTAIRRELMTQKEDAKNAIQSIKDMQSDVEQRAIDMYLETFDLSKSMLYISQYEKQKAEITAREQERIHREEEERIRREEREKLMAEQRHQEELRRINEEAEMAARQAEEEKQVAVEQAKEMAAHEVIDGMIPDFEGGTSLYEYRMSLSDDAREKLEMYLDSVGIEWEII